MNSNFSKCKKVLVHLKQQRSY